LLGVTVSDLWVTAVLGFIVLLIIFLFFKEFMVISFDPVLATTLRLPATFLRYLLLILVAVTIVVSLQVVGIALMVAMLVTPAAAASLLTRRLVPMMFIAAGIGAFSGAAGLYISYYLDIASGPAVVLVATFIFALAFLLAPERGLIWRRN
jgi:ABC-type Mn2+/Zn2+ transport system permease subunit